MLHSSLLDANTICCGELMLRPCPKVIKNFCVRIDHCQLNNYPRRVLLELLLGY